MKLRLAFLAVLSAVLVPAVGAQRFVGSVALPGGAGPAAGVLVVAEDSTGRLVAESITLDDGSFAIFVDSTATVTLRLLRSGAAPVTVVTKRLGDAQVDTIRAVLPAAAPLLGASVERGSSTCRGRREGKDPVHVLLAQADIALRVTQLRIGRSDVAARFVTFNHRTAKNGTDTLRTAFRRAAGALPALFEPTSTEQLEAGGFFATVGGERVFRAPDAAILTSDWFQETHCFTLRRVTADSLVLEFAPTRERKGLIDIAGEYRFDRRTLDLREIAFSYVGLPAEERKSDAGGVLEFARAANGNWLVAAWNQRVPLLGYRQADGTTTFVRSSMTLVDIIGHRGVGGRVLATLQGSRLTYQWDGLTRPLSTSPFGVLCSERLVTAATSAARGRVVSDSAEALPGVVVRASWEVPVVVDRTQMATREQVRETVTREDGSWALCDLPVKRDVTVRWEVRGKEVKVPLVITEPTAVVDIKPAATP